MPDAPSRAAQLGAVAFLLRPTYIATEVVTAAATTGAYSFVADSVSKLGEVGCSEDWCSPRHEVMNGSFMGYGVLLAGGALLLAKPLRARRLRVGTPARPRRLTTRGGLGPAQLSEGAGGAPAPWPRRS